MEATLDAPPKILIKKEVDSKQWQDQFMKTGFLGDYILSPQQLKQVLKENEIIRKIIF